MNESSFKKSISLIMPTLGRVSEVEKFIISLSKQDYTDYELIVVDQNDNNYIEEICKKYQEKVRIIYVQSDIKGLSKCRNIGLKYASGEIIAFPDDDCEYSEGMLRKVINKFNKNSNIDIVTFKSIDKLSNNDSNNKWMEDETYINHINIENTAISYTIFIRIKEKNDIKFDEKLGVGEYFGSAEETDMLSTLISKGYIAKYTPNIYAYHPIKAEVKERCYKYALGMGAYIKKEIFLRSKLRYLKRAIELIIVRPLGGLILNLLKLDMDNVKKYHFILCGRIRGFLEYKI